MSYRKTLGISLFALGLGLGPALAADPAAPVDAAAPAASQAAATAEFPEAKINSYAAANMKVEALNQRYEAEAQAAADAAARETVIEEKNQKLAEAVQSSGLTVEEYNEIYMASKADATLASRIDSVQGTMEPEALQ
jgi:hypothetical protein